MTTTDTTIEQQPGRTSIQIRTDTKKRLSELIEYKGQTYDDIIQRLLDKEEVTG